MKVAIFNVKFSPNLGDGVLAECFERAVARAMPDAEVMTYDLAGRTRYDGRPNAGRLRAVQALERMPVQMRRTVVRLGMARKVRDLHAYWRDEMRGVGAVIIGGGNLLQDDDLNFPLKIEALLDALRDRGVPVAVAGVGVSAGWSGQAQRMFRKLLDTNLVFAWVRDQQSAENWRHQLGTNPVVAPDPAVSAGTAFDAQRNPAGPVGVCITHPAILRRHSGLAMTSEQAERFYVGLCLALCRETGSGVRLFTNGASEDHAFAEMILASPDLQRSDVSRWVGLAARPASPTELVRTIASMSTVVGHRLHASIVAFSLGIPHVGLAWDPKLRSFYVENGRGAFVAAEDDGTDAIAHLITSGTRIDVQEEARKDAGERFERAVNDLTKAILASADRSAAA